MNLARRPAVLTAAVALLSAAGCGRCAGEGTGEGGDDGADPGPALEEAACAPTAGAPALTGTLRMALFVGEGVEPAELEAHARDLSAFYGALGLTIEVAGPPTRLPIAAAFLGAGEGAARRVERGSGDTAFAAPLGRLLREHGAPLPGTINVALLPRIASPSSAVAIQLRDLSGLTITRETVAALGLGDRPLRPTILLSRRDLERVPAMQRRTTLAHELGHALGLDHRAEPTNLMAQVRPRPCRPVLDAGQRETAAATLPHLHRRQTARP